MTPSDQPTPDAPTSPTDEAVKLAKRVVEKQAMASLKGLHHPPLDFHHADMLARAVLDLTRERQDAHDEIARLICVVNECNLTMTKANAEVTRLRERQRTPGAYEVCPQCDLRLENITPGECGMFKGPIPCPLRTAQTQKDTAP